MRLRLAWGGKRARGSGDNRIGLRGARPSTVPKNDRGQGPAAAGRVHVPFPCKVPPGSVRRSSPDGLPPGAQLLARTNAGAGIPAPCRRAVAMRGGLAARRASCRPGLPGPPTVACARARGPAVVQPEVTVRPDGILEQVRPTRVPFWDLIVHRGQGDWESGKKISRHLKLHLPVPWASIFASAAA